jgi:hypothetical protein
MTKILFFIKKIADISLLSRNYLCCNMFMTLLNDVVSIHKGIIIDDVVSLNVYKNPSFCCTLFVFKNGISTPWLSLKFSSIKNSGLGVFPYKISRRTNSLLVILVKLMDIQVNFQEDYWQSREICIWFIKRILVWSSNSAWKPSSSQCIFNYRI